MRSTEGSSDVMTSRHQQRQQHHHLDHHQHQHQQQQQQQQQNPHTSQSDARKRMRYYTPQLVMNRQFDETNSTSSKHLVGPINTKIHNLPPTPSTTTATTRRDSGYISDQKIDSETAATTCFKGLIQSGRSIQQSAHDSHSLLLRRCISAAPTNYPARGRRLPELPDKTCLTSDRYHSTADARDPVKGFSSLSAATHVDGRNLFGLPKAPKKQRPKLDSFLAVANAVAADRDVYAAASRLSPTLMSKAEAENKNFLCDLYLKKADDCLDEFQFKREIWNSSECMRHLDRCIEFYELALKALGGGKDFENSRILLRTKQSKVILMKRNLWRTKVPLPPRQSSVGTIESRRNGSEVEEKEDEERNGKENDYSGYNGCSGYKVDFRNGYQSKSRLSFAADRTPIAGNLDYVLAPKRTIQRTMSATPLRSQYLSTEGGGEITRDGGRGGEGGEGDRMKRSHKVPVHGKISAAFGTTFETDLRSSGCHYYGRSDSLKSGRGDVHPLLSSSSSSSSQKIVRLKLPEIAESRSRPLVDVTSRPGRQPVVKISLV